MFFSKKLQKFKNIKHCFFSRNSGVSLGIYESLNCGIGSNDNKKNVLKNLKLVSGKINCKKDSLITLNQKHTDQVVHFKNETSVKNKLTADAIVSEVKNIGISILTADCAPILFYDPKKKIIGCAHSGWKGALNGIIKNTVKKFNELNSDNNDLIAVIGPCISRKNYEVKKDFFDKFISQDKNNAIFFKLADEEKFLFDLRGFINKEILNLGIKNIENIEMDTFSNKKFFYSYRRSQLNKEKDYGRCISVILMT
jgi:YfiH family protein